MRRSAGGCIQVGRREVWSDDPEAGEIKTVGHAWSTWLGIDWRQIDNAPALRVVKKKQSMLDGTCSLQISCELLQVKCI